MGKSSNQIQRKGLMQQEELKSEDDDIDELELSAYEGVQSTNRKLRDRDGEVKRVHTSEFAKIFKSKADIYRILMVEGKFFSTTHTQPHNPSRPVLSPTIRRMHNGLPKNDLQWIEKGKCLMHQLTRFYYRLSWMMKSEWCTSPNYLNSRLRDCKAKYLKIISLSFTCQTSKRQDQLTDSSSSM